MSTPRVILQELPSGRILDWAVPLREADVTAALSGPGGLAGALPEGYVLPVREWGAALWVEDSGTFHGGGIVTTVEHQDRSIRAGCVGLTGYAQDMPWLAKREDLIKVDPLNIVRKIWAHLQGQQGGNLHLTVDDTTSTVRVGEEEGEVEFTTSEGEEVRFEVGPFRLNPIDTQDLAKTIDDLAADTPFDYRVRTFWEGDAIRHRLELGYPHLGIRRTGLQLDTRTNLIVLPVLGFNDEDYASEVLMIGAGEGRKAVTAHVPSTPERLRRVAVLADKSIRTKNAATRAAREELSQRTFEGTVSSVVVVDSPAAPLAEIAPGDTVRLTGPLATGAQLDHWVRVVEMTRALDDFDRAELTVIPA